MFVLYRYENLKRLGSEFKVGKPITWCEDENKAEDMFLDYLYETDQKDDYTESDNPTAFNTKTSDYGGSKEEGYVIADLPRFNPNSGPDYVNTEVKPGNVVRRFDKFNLNKWRDESIEHEQKLCEITGMVLKRRGIHFDR